MHLITIVVHKVRIMCEKTNKNTLFILNNERVKVVWTTMASQTRVKGREVWNVQE